MCRQIVAKELKKDFNMARDKMLTKVPGFSERTVLKRPASVLKRSNARECMSETSVQKRPKSNTPTTTSSQKAKKDEDIGEEPEEEQAEEEAEEHEQAEGEAEKPSEEASAEPSRSSDNYDWKRQAAIEMSELPFESMDPSVSGS